MSNVEFKMPALTSTTAQCPLTLTQTFINGQHEEIGPLLNVLRRPSESANLYLGIGDGEVGTKGVVLGCHAALPDLDWFSPKIFPPLLGEEVTVEALRVKRPPDTGGGF